MIQERNKIGWREGSRRMTDLLRGEEPEEGEGQVRQSQRVFMIIERVRQQQDEETQGPCLG